MSNPTETLVLELYRAAAEMRFEQFQDWALEQLAGVVRFDAAWWGRSVLNAQAPLSVKLFNADPSIFEDYPKIADVDFFRDAMFATPGKAVNLADLIERKDFEQHRLFRLYGRKHKVNAALGIVTVDPISHFVDNTTLWRFDPRWPFGEGDRLNLERVFAHLLQANRICRILSVSRQDGLAAVRHPLQPWAIVGRSDLCLLEVNSAFVDLLRLQWPSWRGATLPNEVAKPLRQTSRFNGSKIAIEALNAGDFRLLAARTVAGIDSLGRRERDVIELFAAGKPYKLIAEQLSVSPTTIRNQLAAAYRKLGVHNKAELVNLLRDSAP